MNLNSKAVGTSEQGAMLDTCRGVMNLNSKAVGTSEQAGHMQTL